VFYRRNKNGGSYWLSTTTMTRAAAVVVVGMRRGQKEEWVNVGTVLLSVWILSQHVYFRVGLSILRFTSLV
jgi:hypothetical protein